MRSNTYKLILVGDGGVGKSSYIKKLRISEFKKGYIATMGVKVYPLNFENDKYGDTTFKIWDCAGLEKFKGLGDGYYVGGQCAIVMFDLSSPILSDRIFFWTNKIRNVCDNIPIVIVGSKSDTRYQHTNIELLMLNLFNDESLFINHENLIEYIEISTKEDINLDEPFLILLEELNK
uniref:Ras family GTPase n=1 Tax=Pithovirus LCDPAC02 TaxID=2506601 RepID=A0A481YNV5_9VIRU|nr:MAG: Ras family GTPase [Pithovirus LCDPAC02]